MSDGDYLWDRTGPRDPEVADLEDRLAAFRHAPARRRAWRRYAAAAAVLLCAGAALLAFSGVFSEGRRGGPGAAWSVEWIAGSGAERLAVGEWLLTDDASKARLDVAGYGRVDLAPNSRVRLVATGREEHRLELARGTLHALVYTPPRLFVVDTPAATAVDLGCAYTLEVEEDGSGLLEVTAGQVQLENGAGLVSLVPRGAACRMRPGQGPGVPYYRDAPAPLRDVDPADAAAVAAAVAAARPDDALTLRHLLPRVHPSLRSSIEAALD